MKSAAVRVGLGFVLFCLFSQYALAVPNGPTTYLTNTTRTANSIDLVWINIASSSDSPTGTIVFARSGISTSAPFAPIDDTYYPENANYSAAPSSGSGWRCISHQEADTGISVLGLNANTTYTFLAYPWDGDIYGSVDFLTITPKFLQARTLAAEPTLAASAIAFSGVGGTNMTVGWTRGNGSGVLVIVRSGAIPANPADGTTYAANADFGTGVDIGSGSFVAYNGTGSSVAVTGLTPSTTYYVTVIEYNGSATGENYLLTGRPTASRSTVMAAPTISAGSISFSSVGANQMTIGWTLGNGSRRLVLMRDGVITSDPVNGTNYTPSATYGNGTQFGDGSFAVFDGINGPVTVSGLNPSTTYYVEIFEYNGTGESAAYKTADPGAGNKGTLATEPTTQASAVEFASVVTNGMTVNWTSGNGANRLVVMRGTNAISGNPADGVAYAVSNALGGGIVVYNGVGATVDLSGLAAGGLYYFRVYEFNGAAVTCNYLTDTALDNPNSRRTMLHAPALNATASISVSGFTVSWSASASAEGYRLDVSTQADCLSGYVGSYNGLDVANSLQHAVTGLEPGTRYYFRVKAYAGSSTSVYSSISSSWTLPSAPAALNATNATAVSFYANWLSTVSATGYRLDVATDEAFSSPVVGFNNLDVGTALTWLVTGLSPAQTYYYRVRAENSSGTSVSSSTIAATTAPAAPVAIPGTFLSTNSFQAFWLQADGATGYCLDVSTNSSFSNFVQGFANLNVGLVTTHTVLNTDMRVGVTNYYRVRAYNASGTSTNSNIERAYNSTMVVLYSFDLMRCGTEVKAVWETASEEDTVGFYLHRLNSDSSWTQINSGLVPAGGVGGMGASYSVLDPEAVPGQTYIYKLVEVETDGMRNEYGPFARNTEEFMLNQPITRSEEGIVIKWLSSVAESYNILRSTNLVDGFSIIASGLPGAPPVNTFTDTDPSIDTVFYKVVVDRVAGP